MGRFTLKNKNYHFILLEKRSQIKNKTFRTIEKRWSLGLMIFLNNGVFKMRILFWNIKLLKNCIWIYPYLDFSLKKIIIYSTTFFLFVKIIFLAFKLNIVGIFAFHLLTSNFLFILYSLWVTLITKSILWASLMSVLDDSSNLFKKQINVSSLFGARL